MDEEDEEDLVSAIDAVLDEAIASGNEVGIQVAVIRDGRTLIDTARGVADPLSGTAVDHDTLFWAASTAKGVASTVAHTLVEQGELGYDLRIVEVWPEFAAHGKDQITLRHVLDHTAGVPFLPPDTTTIDLCDWEHMCSVIAESPPAWATGSRFGYHAKTFGFLLGEVVRRSTSDTISTLLRASITGPLGIADEVHFGVPSALLSRVAQQVSADGPVPSPPEPGSPAARAMPPGVQTDADYANRADLLRSDIPSEGTMTARGVARVYSALLGHVDGVTLVSPERLREMAAITFTGNDAVMGVPASWAFGYSPFRPNGRGHPGSTFGMVGMNGSAAYADISSSLAVAVMRNRFTVGDLATAARIDRVIHDALHHENTTDR